MGKKLLVALMMEGKFSGEGLDGFEEDDDMMSSMVRELLEEGGVGESADAIWASLPAQRARMFSFDDSTAHRIEANDTDLGIGQAFEVRRSAMPWESVHKVAEPEPGLWSHKTAPVPVFTWSAESESCRKSYPLRTRRRHLECKHSGQLSFFEMPTAL
ncbi:hypothetical protein [Tunturiibacter lichenicola]|uniref:hypothetical protein n=1 Tax=Tunturiibacter lichenicola TaxID=2051959 RepID=UPI003D9B4007